MSTLTKAEINRETAERFLNGTHSKNIADIDIIDETVGETIVCHGFPGFVIEDRESYKNFFRTFRRSFTDMDWTVHALIADDTYVSARWQIEATFSSDFAGAKADGRRVAFDGMVLYRMEDGLIVETWLHLNEMMLLAAIGAIPAPSPEAKPTVLLFSFPFPGPWGDELASVTGALARDIAGEDGLCWKLWLENADAGRAGGVYLFRDAAAAARYRAKHEARLATMGLSDIHAETFSANTALTAITGAAAPLLAMARALPAGRTGALSPDT